MAAVLSKKKLQNQTLTKIIYYNNTFKHNEMLRLK